MRPFDTLHDALVRKATFDWLSMETAKHGDVLPFKLLAQGFDYQGQRVPLLGPQGIFKPQVLREAPLTITTVYGGPYDDSFSGDGLLEYRYRARGGPTHRDNEGLRVAMARRLPLDYFHGVIEARYLAVWPVFVVRDDAASQTFRIAVDDSRHLNLPIAGSGVATGDEAEDARRRYSTAVVRVRLHQRGFRERVLTAYRHQCAFCRLRHQELLDAAHLIPDADPTGDPLVKNGVALCALHHAAFTGRARVAL